MINHLKNIKWVIITASICIPLGILTFLTFIDESFIELNEFNLQFLLILNLLLLLLFFTLIIRRAYQIFKERKQDKVGSETSFRYITFFSLTTLLPALFIAIFSLILFNFGLQKYFNKKITSAINNSYDVAKNYVEATNNSIEADILLILIDVNTKTGLFYDNPKQFQNVLRSQRLLRRLDGIYLLDGSSNIIMSDVVDSSSDFVPPTEEAFNLSISGKPIRITDSTTNRTSALIKLGNFIDTYLYIVRLMDPRVIGYLKETEQAVNFYYIVENNRTGIKITFAIIYIVIVSLLLFLSIVIAINFASRFTKPIINLIKASEKISAGDLNVKVPQIETDEEVKKLNENFNFMIERLKKQQDRLLLAERFSAWRNVARKLSHEIKNPLTPIQLSIDRIKEKYLHLVGENKKDLSGYLNTINKQIKDIEKLVNEFSNFARMPQPTFTEVNLVNIITAQIKLNESQKNITFELKKNKDNFFVKGDEGQLNRTFLNLFKNSIESINEKIEKDQDFKGKINIDIYQDSDYIYTTIQDNGLGFSEEDTDKMLNPYYTTKKNGTGLGLAIVSKILNEHNADIKFHSNLDGAKVEISIPRYYD